MNDDLTIAFMVKVPRPGLVKTRLAQTLGHEQSCAVYRWMAERQSAVFPESWPVVVHFAPADAKDEMRAWLGPRPAYRPQPEGDLGERMFAAAQADFASGSQRVVLVGADCPAIQREDFETVAKRLRSDADIVFGPATDGGYYLVGMNRLVPEIFAAVPWSSPETLSISLRRCRSLGLRAALLELKEDVDDEAGLQRAVAAGLIPREIAAG